MEAEQSNGDSEEDGQDDEVEIKGKEKEKQYYQKHELARKYDNKHVLDKIEKKAVEGQYDQESGVEDIEEYGDEDDI